MSYYKLKSVGFQKSAGKIFVRWNSMKKHLLSMYGGFCKNKKMVDLPQNLTEEEKEWLDSDW